MKNCFCSEVIKSFVYRFFNFCSKNMNLFAVSCFPTSSEPVVVVVVARLKTFEWHSTHTTVNLPSWTPTVQTSAVQIFPDFWHYSSKLSTSKRPPPWPVSRTVWHKTCHYQKWSVKVMLNWQTERARSKENVRRKLQTRYAKRYDMPEARSHSSGPKRNQVSVKSV